MGFSTSGNSKDLMEGYRKAKELGILTFGMAGGNRIIDMWWHYWQSAFLTACLVKLEALGESSLMMIFL